MRHNAPYNIAYGLGIKDGRDYPDRPGSEILISAKKVATSIANPFSGSPATRRYFRELGAAYLAGISEGRGHILTEDEWVSTYKHPILVYTRMRFGNSLDRKNPSRI
jgi:hypothetical protein